MKTALITGASSGIGAAFATELAAQNHNLVLVARSQHKLESFAAELTKKWQIDVQIIAQDLTATQACQKVYEQISDWGINVDLLVNNAGFGDYGKFSKRDLAKQLTMIQLNVSALVELTYLFLPGMQQREQGGIINVSSIAAFQPLPYLSVYAASKAFVLSFSEALWAENQGTGVKILALCPGPTESNFFRVAEFPDSGSQKGQNQASATEVVKEALAALAKNQATVVTGGLSNQVIVNLPRFFPRETIVSLVEKQFKP